ncbi:MAG: hypothetical protein ACOYXN_07160 [Acidobacteriota bacterium]
MWLHVEGRDETGRIHLFSVIPRGFPGEELTIGASGTRRIDPWAEPARPPSGPEILRPFIHPGDRLFRRVALDGEGNPTALPWKVASFGADTRLGPGETTWEEFEVRLPEELARGSVEVEATLFYRRLPPKVADVLGMDSNLPVLIVARSRKTLPFVRGRSENGQSLARFPGMVPSRGAECP